ncbi:MAG: LacI family DNA-binding transcriptional regulator [Labrys sp. (in: a-proteobacteria)]
MATIKDVARESGVSVTTVSHVVNDTRAVATETRARVEEAVRRLDYRPSSVARALKANRTHTIGMLVTTSTNPFFAEVIHGVETGCFEAGYSLILGNTGDVSERLLAYWRTLAGRRIDGLVVMTTNAAPEFFDELTNLRRLPVIALDTRSDAADCVIKDDSYIGGQLAGRHLASFGFRRIACVTGPAAHPRSIERLDGFRAGLAESGITLAPSLIRTSDLTIAGGHAAVFELLRLDAERPDAIFCFNDMLAMGGLRAAHEQGLDVPGDVSIMGYDDTEFAAFTAPPLTTVQQPALEIGRTAARAMIEHLDEGRALPRVISLEPRLVVRRSVGPAKGGRTH